MDLLHREAGLALGKVAVEAEFRIGERQDSNLFTARMHFRPREP